MAQTGALAADVLEARESNQVLWLLSADPVLQEQCARVAAAAGKELAIANSSGELPDLRGDPLLIGADQSMNSHRLADVFEAYLVGSTQDMSNLWQAGERLGIQRIVVLPEGASWLVSQLAGSDESAQGRAVGVMSACGGIGASTFAAALALMMATRTQHTVLVDADPLGGGIENILGVEGQAGSNWSQLRNVEGSLSGSRLIESLPSVENLRFLGWGSGNPSAELSELGAHFGPLTLVMDAITSTAQTTIIDVGRWTIPEWSVLPWCQQLLLLVKPDLNGLVAARRLLAYVDSAEVGLLLTGKLPDGYLPVDVGNALGAKVLASWPHRRQLARAVASGQLFSAVSHRAYQGPLTTIAESLQHSSQRNKATRNGRQVLR